MHLSMYAYNAYIATTTKAVVNVSEGETWKDLQGGYLGGSRGRKWKGKGKLCNRNLNKNA